MQFTSCLSDNIERQKQEIMVLFVYNIIHVLWIKHKNMLYVSNAYMVDGLMWVFYWINTLMQCLKILERLSKPNISPSSTVSTIISGVKGYGV